MLNRLPTLKSATNTLEDAIITLSGPALAVSGIIAGVDLLTGGTMLKSLSWLALAWAISLLLTLDFQVLSLGARAHKIYQDDSTSTRRKACEMILAFIIAASISYVSIQMQSIIARANTGISIEQATIQLGINPLALIWERSSLVLLLIFMSGWFRQEVKHTLVPSVPALVPLVPSEIPAAISDETVQLILSKLAKLEEIEQAVFAAKVTVNEASGTPIALLGTSEKGSEASDISEEPQEDETSLEAQIAALLAKVPDITSRDVAAIVGKPHSTVYRHMAKLKKVEQVV